MADSANDATILDRLGGEAFLDECVEDIYFRVLADKMLYRFFRSVNTVQLMQHQRIFLSILFSTRNGLEDAVLESLRLTHKSVGATDQHFDKFFLHVVASIRSYTPDDHLVQDIKNTLLPLRYCFVSTKAKQPEGNLKNSALRRLLDKAKNENDKENVVVVSKSNPKVLEV